jgi:hypothetical protein
MVKVITNVTERQTKPPSLQVYILSDVRNLIFAPSPLKVKAFRNSVYNLPINRTRLLLRVLTVRKISQTTSYSL